jgi:hypothetical protein
VRFDGGGLSGELRGVQFKRKVLSGDLKRPPTNNIKKSFLIIKIITIRVPIKTK